MRLFLKKGTHIAINPEIYRFILFEKKNHNTLSGSTFCLGTFQTLTLKANWIQSARNDTNMLFVF